MPSYNEKSAQDNKGWVWEHISGLILTSLVVVFMGLIRMLGSRTETTNTPSKDTPQLPNLDLSLSGSHEQMVCAAGRVLGAIAAVKHSNVGFMALGEIACEPLLFQGVVAPTVPTTTTTTPTTTTTTTTPTTTTTTPTTTPTTTTPTTTTTTPTTTTTTPTTTTITPTTTTITPTTTTTTPTTTTTTTTTTPTTTTTTTTPITTTTPTTTTTTEPTTTTAEPSTITTLPTTTTTSIMPPPPPTTTTTSTTATTVPLTSTTTIMPATTMPLPSGLVLAIINQGEIGVKSNFPSIIFSVGLSDANIGKLKKESNSAFNSASGILTIKDTPIGVNTTLHQMAFCASIPGAMLSPAQQTLILAASGNVGPNTTWVYATGSLADVYTSKPPTLTNSSYPLQRLQLGESGRFDLKADPHFVSANGDPIIDYDCTLPDGSKCIGANIKNGIMVIAASEIEQSTSYHVYARNWCAVSTDYASINVTIEHIAPSVVNQPIAMTSDTGVSVTVNLPVLFRGYKLKDFSAFLANGDLLPSSFAFTYSSTVRQLKMRADENSNYTIVFAARDDYDYPVETNATYTFKNIPPQLIKQIPSQTILPAQATTIDIPAVCTSTKRLKYDITQNGALLTWSRFTPPTSEQSGSLIVEAPDYLIGQTRAFNLTCDDGSIDGKGRNQTSFVVFIPPPAPPIALGLPNKTIRAESTDSIKGIQGAFYSRSYPNTSIIIAPNLTSLQKWMTWNNIPGAQNIELNPNVDDAGVYAVSLMGRDPAGNEVGFTVYVTVDATGWQMFVNWVQNHSTMLSVLGGLGGGLITGYQLYQRRSDLYNFCKGKNYVVDAENLFDENGEYNTQLNTDDVDVAILKWVGAGNSWWGCLDAGLGWMVSWSHYLEGKWNLHTVKLATPWIEQVISTKSTTKTHLIRLHKDKMPDTDYPIVLQVKHRDGRILAETNLNPRDLQLQQPLLKIPEPSPVPTQPAQPKQLEQHFVDRLLDSPAPSTRSKESEKSTTVPAKRNSLFEEQRRQSTSEPLLSSPSNRNSSEPPTRRPSEAWQNGGLFPPPGMSVAEFRKQQALQRACGIIP